MTHAFTRLFVGLLASSWLAVYACSGPNDPPRVLAAGVYGNVGPADASSGGGSTGMAGAGGNSYTPSCGDVPVTAAGVAPTKGGVCTTTDSQLCYKTCGPLSLGFKSETCSSGTYVEQKGCSFPSQDYSCYKIPPAIDATCPTTTPKAGDTCDVATCVLCNVQDSYFDSSGSSKAGYCVCPQGGDSGARRWSCASSSAWPCPGGQGC
ncbi:MAG TPA: hypothetical protein VGI10_15895 [Polyangiaceae bacterium]